MSDKPAREFCIREGAQGWHICAENSEGAIRLVEKDLYDELIAQADKLSEALDSVNEYMKTHEGELHYNVGTEALTDWQKFRSGI